MLEISLGIVMVAKDMQPMTQTSITALEKALRFAGLIDDSFLAIVDNSSTDPMRTGTFTTEIPYRVIRLDKNHSFSAASNFGARAASSANLLLFLNNDVFLHPLAIASMRADMERFNASICGARLVYPNGLIQHAGVGFAPGMEGPHHLHHLVNTRLVPRVTSAFQSITGAAMMIDSGLFWQLNGFDESFPFAYEDTDFCLRAAAIGATTICSQTVDSIHLSGQTRNVKTQSFEKLAREIFLARWGGRVTAMLAGEGPKN